MIKPPSKFMIDFVKLTLDQKQEQIFILQGILKQQTAKLRAMEVEVKELADWLKEINREL